MHFQTLRRIRQGDAPTLSARIAEFLKDGRVDQEEMPAYSELTRRLGFEYNGMVLHEHYFGNMARGGSGDPDRRSPFVQAVEMSFGSYAIWKTDFVSVGKMRGVGWAICYQDPTTRQLSNHWITLHEVGNVAGFVPVLVMDVWEHAFILVLPAGRASSLASRPFSPTLLGTSLSEASSRLPRRPQPGAEDPGTVLLVSYGEELLEDLARLGAVDVVIESADIVRVRSDPWDVVAGPARATYRKVVQNLWRATGYNIGTIPGRLESWPVPSWC
jgi:superoxide dismutase